MVLNVVVSETVGDEDRTHTMRSKIATGPNYNFAETFFVFLEYAHKVKVRIKKQIDVDQMTLYHNSMVSYQKNWYTEFFAQNFITFQISIDLCYPEGLNIATKFLIEKDIHCQFKVTANEFNGVFKDPMWALKKSAQSKNGTLNYNCEFDAFFHIQAIFSSVRSVTRWAVEMFRHTRSS